jgi:hypothetical protein
VELNCSTIEKEAASVVLGIQRSDRGISNCVPSSNWNNTVSNFNSLLTTDL